jgi:DNA polymerase-3 subunit delta
MKLKWNEIEPYVQKPRADIPVILVYGPDEGLMRERARLLGKSVVADLADPFNVVDLSHDVILATPARLYDEASSLSLMGGRRLIRIRDAKDALSAVLKDFLKSPPPGDYLIVIEGENFGTKSTLRALCERSDKAVTIPCYNDDAKSLRPLIIDTLKKNGLTIQDDALAFLLESLTADRALSRAEIDKLILYKGRDQSPITMADVKASSGGYDGLSLDDLMLASCDGHHLKVQKILPVLLGEGMPVVTILRSVQNHFRRLSLINAHMADGFSFDEVADKKINPPVFFKLKEKYQNHCRTFANHADVLFVYTILGDAESKAKSSGYPDQLILERALFVITQKSASLLKARGTRRAAYS